MSVNAKMTAIADAIREKTGGTDALTLDQMAAAISGITVGGGGSAVPAWVKNTYDITIGENAVTNTSEAIAYFNDVTSGGGTRILIMCKDEFTQNNQIFYFNFLYSTSCMRYRNGGVGIANVSTSYDAVLPVGAVYTVWEV